MLFPGYNSYHQILNDELFVEKQVSLTVLRLDNIHPVISGNKLFKLHYFMEEAVKTSSERIVTFGGAYSNHLVATAYACQIAGLQCIGIVRGEKPSILSHTLQSCIEYGMHLKFTSREQYAEKEMKYFIDELDKEYKKNYIIPEGGYHPSGAKGAAHIMKLVEDSATHICCAAGTATTLAGLLMGAGNHQKIIGFPVLKNMHDLHERVSFLTNTNNEYNKLQIIDDYHFGGYAKKTPTLIDFMNNIYKVHLLPTDFVYTGKMMFGVMDSIKKDFFEKGSKICCLHTGGLQGNLSLPDGSLIF